MSNPDFIKSISKHSLFFFLLLSLCLPSFIPRPSSLVSSLPLLPGRSCLFPFEDGFLDDGHGDPSLTPGLNSPTRCQNGERMERYSRKVFVGGLPPDIDEGELPLAVYLYWYCTQCVYCGTLATGSLPELTLSLAVCHLQFHWSISTLLKGTLKLQYMLLI